MRRVPWLLFLSLAAGCGAGAPAADLGMPDAAVGGRIGAACAADGDCGEGMLPVCFVKTLFNGTGVLRTDGGYCSSRCRSRSDCGAGGTCVDLGTFGAWCFADCDEATGCRAGYACFYSPAPHCFPGGNLTCDPNVGDGRCVTGGGAGGGCIRYALGAGPTGLCTRGCPIGPGTCPVNQQCILWARNGSYGGSAQNRFSGPICVATTTPAPTGAPCASLTACVDGDECFSAKLLTAGDDRCHPLCAPAGDGGVGCAPASACADVFGLFDGGLPIGLCL